MGSLLLQLLREAGPAVQWVAVFVAVVIGIFVAYVGIALVVVLRSKDEKTREAHYRVFRDLLGLFQHKRS